MKTLKNFLINVIKDSNLGLLRGEVGFFNSEVSYKYKNKPFTKLSFWNKFVAYFFVSISRFLYNLITIFIPSSMLVSLIICLIHNEHLINGWLYSFFRISLAFTIVISIFYVIISTIVNTISIIYYIKK